ncbi:MAG: hypothetical protein M0R32_09470 [Candidatus Cloacimonetes bacterium]|jgi:hypothetical protein|nr:hypothetical protein [Candidatus Cloacimonadota bacterium]
MKFEKTASGSQKITISKAEWLHIGKQAGWTSYKGINDVDQYNNSDDYFKRDKLKQKPLRSSPTDPWVEILHNVKLERDSKRFDFYKEEFVLVECKGKGNDKMRYLVIQAYYRDDSKLKVHNSGRFDSLSEANSYYKKMVESERANGFSYADFPSRLKEETPKIVAQMMGGNGLDEVEIAADFWDRS